MRTKVIKPWTIDDRRWTVDEGRWTTIDDRRWTVDEGRWTVVHAPFVIHSGNCHITRVNGEQAAPKN
ncbi:MAG: hypothetical protein IPN76_14620 [Saprospiraceae bacterium]|nr:hypothetical protein [Saprospiraceae bacterium]